MGSPAVVIKILVCGVVVVVDVDKVDVVVARINEKFINTIKYFNVLPLSTYV